MAMDRSALKEAARARRAALSGAQAESRAARVPGGSMLRPSPAVATELRASQTTQGGKNFLTVSGYATTYERSYDMCDFWGPYSEIVSPGAAAATLAASPDVVFLVNHKGLPLARTSNGTLELVEDGTGLLSTAHMNPQRHEAVQLYEAISDESVREMSFAFMITQGDWSPDYEQFRIQAFDLDRGDTSAVTYGANPTTSIAARAADFLGVLRSLDPAIARHLLAQHQGAAPVRAPRPRFDRAIDELRALRLAVRDGSGLDSDQTATLTALLGALADADEAFDPFAAAARGADAALDLGQATLAELLGVPNPDKDPVSAAEVAGAASLAAPARPTRTGGGLPLAMAEAIVAAGE